MQTPKINPADNFANVLTKAVQAKNGYMKDLRQVDKLDGDGIQLLEAIGFIKTGSTADAKTFGVTKLGQEYFNDFLANNRKEGFNAIG